MYTVPEDDPGSVPLCVDLGVEITQPLTYTITTAQKSPSEAEGMVILRCYSKILISNFEISQIQISQMEPPSPYRLLGQGLVSTLQILL